MAVQIPPTPECDKRKAVAFTPREPAHVLTEFYDWLEAQGIVLARYGTTEEVAERCPDCRTAKGVREPSLRYRERQLLAGREINQAERASILARVEQRGRSRCPRCRGVGTIYERRAEVNPSRLYPFHEPPERLFARFFDLNLDAIESEKLAILEAIRAA